MLLCIYYIYIYIYIFIYFILVFQRANKGTFKLLLWHNVGLTPYYVLVCYLICHLLFSVLFRLLFWGKYFRYRLQFK